jgi:hypothetical protein
MKPFIKHLGLAIVLFVIVSLLWNLYTASHIMDLSTWGVPLPVFSAWGPCRPGETCSETSLLNLAFDLVIWFGLVSLGSWVVQRKKQTS